MKSRYDLVRKGSGVSLQPLDILHHGLGANALFQVVVEIFIRPVCPAAFFSAAGQIFF